MPTDMGTPSICILGLGTMGTAMAQRLREKSCHLSVWNRSPEKALSLATQDSRIKCDAASAAAAINLCAEQAVVILILSDTNAVLSTLRQEGMAAALQGKTLVNLTSGNPDEGRILSKELIHVGAGHVPFIDGAFCGAPTKARTGTGQIFVSSTQQRDVEKAKEVLSYLGSVSYCGDIGASRALDYGVVDLFFVNLLSFMSNAASLEREGVDMSTFFKEAAKRLATVPAALELYHKKMGNRDENTYKTDVTVTLDTSRSYWAARLPYNEAHGIPSDLANFYVRLLDEARGGEGGAFGSADVSRLQEVVRYGISTSSRSDSGGKKSSSEEVNRKSFSFSPQSLTIGAVLGAIATVTVMRLSR